MILPLLLLLGGTGAAIAASKGDGRRPKMSREKAIEFLRANSGKVLRDRATAVYAGAALKTLGAHMHGAAVEAGLDPDDCRISAPWALEQYKRERAEIIKPIFND